MIAQALRKQKDKIEKKGKKEKEKFLKWLDQMEYKVFGIPRPNLIIFLNIPFRIGQRLVIKKGTRGYLKGVKRDIHESSKSHLSAAQRQVLDLANKYTKWKKVDCVKGNKLLSKKEISEAVWEIVMKVL